MHVGRLVSADTWRLDRNIWTLIVMIVAVIMVFETTPWLALAALGVLVGTLYWLARKERLQIAFQTSMSLVTVAGITGTIYLAISILWSGDPRATAISAGLLAVLLATVNYASAIFKACPRPWIEHTARAVLVTWIIALGWLLFELLSDDAFKKALFWPFWAVRWPAGGVPYLDWAQGPVSIKPQAIKWNMAPLNYLLWPALLILSVQPVSAPFRWPLSAGLIGALALTIHLSDHKTSLAALAVAIAVFVAAQKFPTAVFRVLQSYWILGFIVIIPFAIFAYKSEMHLSNRVGPTFAARMILWNVTAERIANQPILGVGAAATNKIDNQREARSPAPKPPGFQYALRTGPHAHNVFLQSWYELGIVGTAIFMAAGLLVLDRIRRYPAGVQPYVLAIAATVLVTDTASFGLFEPWFMATFAICCIFTLLAVAEHERVAGD